MADIASQVLEHGRMLVDHARMMTEHAKAIAAIERAQREDRGELDDAKGGLMAEMGALAKNDTDIKKMLGDVLQLHKSPWFYAAVAAGAMLSGLVAGLLREFLK